MKAILGAVLLVLSSAGAMFAQAPSRYSAALSTRSAGSSIDQTPGPTAAGTARRPTPGGDNAIAGNPSEARRPTSFGDSLITSATASPMKLGPGDLVEIGVFDSPDLTVRARVNSSGTISFPLLGALAVGGLTPEETQKSIEEQLADKDLVKNPQVSVFVLEYANQAVYVLGEVNRPGAYPVMGSHRLFDFISAAGGLTNRAGRSITITSRGANSPKTVHIAHDPDFKAGNPEVEVGDTIYIGQAGLVYVVGDVQHPGGFLMDSGEKLTVMQALALAQGARPTAALGKARLVRTTDQGRDEIPLDLGKIFASQANDIQLQDQDIVYVPNSAARSGLRRALEAAVQAAVGVTIYGRY